tara:strand:+ start:2388 stop:3077 length:690 start_codon:yes stop_codon:yes gene_type:complete
MLALKQALSLVSTRSILWSPSQEASLGAWYKKGAGITAVGAAGEYVSEWRDSSGNDHHMTQSVGTERPLYNESTRILSFVSSALSNLQTTSQITLTADFTIGLKINTSTTNGAFLADNTSHNEFFKFASATKISVKLGGSATATDLELDSGTFGDDYLVITRHNDVLSLFHQGIEQNGTPTMAGTLLLDVIGLRRLDNNAFDGFITEISIFSSSSNRLTEDLNERLRNL